MILTGIRHSWPEKAGFCLNRKYGHADYSFVHFITGVTISLNGITVDIPEHTCLIYRPGTPQFFKSTGPLLHDWFHISDVSEAFFEHMNLPLDTPLYPRHSSFITAIVQEMENEYFARKTCFEELISLKLTELFIKLSRACFDEPSLSVDMPTSERLRKLRSEVLSSLHYPWTVAEMAARIPLSESRFYSVYRAFYGTSPVDDLIHARIDSAKNALLFTDQSISTIAESLGYNNVSHFIRQFHGTVGLSPTQYRKS